MVTMLDLPVIPPQAVTQPPVGIPLSRAALEHEAMPPGSLQVLDGVFRQIENLVLEPLLYGAKPAELSTTFVRQYRRFVPAYISGIMALVAALDQDPQRVWALAMRGFSEASRTLRERGRDRIGAEPTLAALMAIDTMTRVTHRAISSPVELVSSGQKEIVNQWAPLALSHVLCLIAVISFLSRDEQLPGGAVNASVLAGWSKGYAMQVHHLSKSLRLLTPAAPLGPLPTEGDEENQRLADAGLEDYRQLLAQEETALGESQG